MKGREGSCPRALYAVLFLFKSDILVELWTGYGQTINTILYTKRDWDSNLASPFRQNVTEDGIRLWG